MSKTWVLVANRADARVFENSGPGKGLRLVEDIANPSPKGEGYADRAGRAFSSHGPGRHALSHSEEPAERAAANFARSLGQMLHAASHGHRFDRLVLVAEPRFLGLLRGELDAYTRARVQASLDKDLVATPVRRLHRHLDEVMAL